MSLLVKIGGSLLDSETERLRLAREIATLQLPQLVIVHGGGKQMTRFLAERGIESRFIGGLRVTTPEIIDAVLKVFGGSVNHQLVAALNAAGARAVGLSGLDAGLVHAEPLDPLLGLVGRPTRCDPTLLHSLLAAGFLPVVACFAGDSQGRIYNVNADQMAVACAAALQARWLIFLTDVEGVRGPSGLIEPRLTPAEARSLIDQGVATGGMQAKLEAALSGLNAGVENVVIAPGALPGVLSSILAGQPCGTTIA